MAYERLWAAVVRPFSSDGTARGTLQVSNYTGFFVKQSVSLTSNTKPSLTLQIQRIDPDGTIYVGNKGDINSRVDVSAYLVADAAQIMAPEQSYSPVKPDEIINAVYERDPVKAIRTENVDPQGTPIDSVVGPDGKNRMAVDAQVNVEVNSVALFTKPYDAIVPSYPSPTQELYQSKVGGISGTNVQLVTVNYTDSSKNLILNAFRIDN